MKKLKLIAIDLAKNIFQVCGFTTNHTIAFNRSITRHQLLAFIAQQPSMLIAMEACYSSHYWARAFEKIGHTVRLIPAQHVTPFVRGNKSDYRDAIAIAEAACRPNIRPVPVKTLEQQDIQSLHRIRERHVTQRTGLINQTRGLLSEYGIIAPQGHRAFCQLMADIHDSCDTALSSMLKAELAQVLTEYHAHTQRIHAIEQQLKDIAKQNELCRILLSIPGIGVLNATGLFCAIGNGQSFSSGRDLAVWLGLTPRQASSGERFTSGSITKRGNRYVRKQLIHGARAIVSRCRGKQDALSRWVNQLLARRGFAKTCVALAARITRLAWILITRKDYYRAQA